MKILIVANYNRGHFAPFVLEQMDALEKCGCEIETFGIVGNGFMGYLRNFSGLNRKIRNFAPNIIHAHYGLSGLLANLQRKVPVITTFHGSDVHSGGMVLFLSKVAMKYSAYNVFVSEKLMAQSLYNKKNCCVLPCGIDLERFVQMDKKIARAKIGWPNDKKIVLFAGAYSNPVKNVTLAKESIEILVDVRLAEMHGFNREEVVFAMNAADCLLMTSHNEGSPMVIKEAMACGTPIVSVDVGDVKNVIKDTNSCYIANMDKQDISIKIKQVFLSGTRTNGRCKIVKLDLANNLIADKLIKIYRYYYKINHN